MAARVLLATLAYHTALCAGFGLTTTTSLYTVDTGSGLVFSIRRVDSSSTTSPGDIASLKWNGVEYQDQSRGSQINSGFDWLYSSTSTVTVSATTVSSTYIKITVVAGSLTHYYMAKSGEPRIYMGTYFTAEPDVHGHVRYILRIQKSLLPNGPTASDVSATVSTVESSDIFALSNGQTRSKHYSNQRLRDWSYIGATGSSVGMWIVRDSQEGGSGGPFYRSLLNQGGDTDQEITYIVNYGEAQTEDFRFGVLNTYTLVVTTGSAPSTSIDTTWFSSMSLTGYVAASGRGTVTGVGFSNMDGTYTYTVGFKNTQAQYFTTATASSGYFKCSSMLPGTYTMTVYKNEIAVHTQATTVTAGGTTILNRITITADPSFTYTIFRIGDWDGTPTEFLNGNLVTYMHPSDTRITTWVPGDYYVESGKNSQVPAYMWKDVNNGYKIYFKLSAAQYAVSHVVNVGMTCDYSNGRPMLGVNSWSSSLPSASTQPSTRTLTVGTYRGNNVVYTFTVPASAWVQSETTYQVLTVTVISGSSGSSYLSPGISLDAIELLGSGVIADGTYTVTSKVSGKLMEVASASTANGGNVQAYQSNGCTCQQWTFTRLVDGYYKITNVNSGLVLDVADGSAANGGNVEQYQWLNNDVQRWTVLAVGSYYAIINKNSGKAVDLWNSVTTNNANIAQYTYWGGNSQMWTLTSV